MTGYRVRIAAPTGPSACTADLGTRAIDAVWRLAAGVAHGLPIGARVEILDGDSPVAVGMVTPDGLTRMRGNS